MIINNARARLCIQMQKSNKPNWSPTSEELHIFSVLTTTLLSYDPIGIRNALDYEFSFEAIRDEYDIEAAALLRCRAQWPDAPCLGHAIKEVLDHYFADDYPWVDCLFLAEQAMLSIANNRVPLNIDAINNYMAQRRYKWIPIEIK
jgi:hypothetical protein